MKFCVCERKNSPNMCVPNSCIGGEDEINMKIQADRFRNFLDKKSRTPIMFLKRKNPTLLTAECMDSRLLF